ncbi:hypothetical protein VTN00DRAFT_5097 [Thermoascus crustaceus]|uniref:uncharacterized protein n=1 Tax=Thermoascus crustaceus TaxID=5088 RepID=UPI003742872C
MTSTAWTNYPPETNHGTVTSWIPLAASWSMPPECSSSFHLSIFPADIALVAFDPGYSFSVSSSVTCLPPEIIALWVRGQTEASGIGTSQAPTVSSILPIICPDGYYTAKELAVDQSTSVVTCCPLSYSAMDVPHGAEKVCVSNVAPGMTLAYESYLEDSNSLPNTNSWTMETTTITDSSAVAAIPITGLNVKGIIPSTIPPSFVTSTSSSIPTSPPAGSGLSTGEKAGIGVGVGLGAIVLILLLAIIWLLQRRKGLQSSMNQESSTTAEMPEQVPPGELDGSKITSGELHGRSKTPPGELHGGWIPPEMPANRPPVEME